MFLRVVFVLSECSGFVFVLLLCVGSLLCFVLVVVVVCFGVVVVLMWCFVYLLCFVFIVLC